MERAGRVLSRMTKAPLPPEDRARSAWQAAVGKRIGAHAVAMALVRDRLVVQVEDAVWQRQLFTMQRQLLTKIEKIVGPDLVTELEFRVRIPRPSPQREERSNRPSDESDYIEDPVLRRVYRASRRRASA